MPVTAIFGHSDLFNSWPNAALPELPHTSKYVRPMPRGQLLDWKRWCETTEQEAATLTTLVAASDAAHFTARSVAVNNYLAKLFCRADDTFEKTTGVPGGLPRPASDYGLYLFLPERLKNSFKLQRTRALIFARAYSSCLSQDTPTNGVSPAKLGEHITAAVRPVPTLLQHPALPRAELAAALQTSTPDLHQNRKERDA